MSVARPVNQPNSENDQKRTPGRISDSGNWLVTEESVKVDDGFKHSCGTYLMGKKVYLTVRDGLFPLSGSGDVQVETVPYCPKCENKPEGHGFITPGGTIVVN